MDRRIPAPAKLPTAALRSRAAAALIVAFLWPTVAHAQLRIVTYNTTGAPRSGMNIVLQSIGDEQRNGIAKPIDVLLLQEQSNSPSATDTAAYVTMLNTMYSGKMYNGKTITYAKGNVLGSGDTTQTIVYRQETVDLISTSAFGNMSGASPQPRQTLRYQLRPDGYDSSADFYIYNSHYKASQDTAPATDNADKRNTEATAIRTNYNTLPRDASNVGPPALYVGDHNFYDYTQANEPAVQTLINTFPDPAFNVTTNGQAFDPVNKIGTWHNNSSFSDVHTQSPTTTSHYSGQVTGGMDDRFDFQFITGKVKDSEGFDYISGSYHAFGNGGGFCCNSDINTASNPVTFNMAPLPGMAAYSKTQILNALNVVADHIPVVADYQVPAILNAVLGSVPATLTQGQNFDVNVAVNNAADVLTANGADELDFSLTTAFGGAVSGSYFSQMANALAAAQNYAFHLDTSSPGLKTGTIMVQSASPQVAHAEWSFPISYTVLSAALAGDYNGDHVVDALDYVLWRDTYGSTTSLAADGNNSGTIDDGDFDVWKNNFGMSNGSGGGGLAANVPEPTSGLLLAIGICLVLPRAGRLKRWTRATQPL